MKIKIFALIGVLCVFSKVGILAQDTIKAVAGSFLTELNINPLQGSISLNNSINQIKFRYFKNESLAIRYAMGLNRVSKNESETQNYGSNPIDNEINKKYTHFTAGFGFEKHFKGTRRLSPYIGAELALAIKRTSSNTNTKTTKKEIKGTWFETKIISIPGINGGYNYTTTSYFAERGYSSFGINGIVGFDYYVSNHLFVGYEIIFEISKKWYQKIEINETNITTSVPGSGYNSGQNYYPNTEANDFELGPKIINGFRLGYIF